MFYRNYIKSFDFFQKTTFLLFSHNAKSKQKIGTPSVILKDFWVQGLFFHCHRAHGVRERFLRSRSHIRKILDFRSHIRKILILGAI